jgi:hypothetical protein
MSSLEKTLLLISDRPEDEAFAREVATRAGLALRVVATPAAGVDFIEESGAAVIFADTSSEARYQELETQIQDRLGLFSDKINANAIHFISSDELENVPYLIKSQLFGHYVIRNHADPMEAGAHYSRIVRATQSERAFGLQGLLSDGAKIQTVKFQISTQKQNAVEAVKNYLLAAKFQTRMATVIANAVDELLMNAMFDAPVDELGKPVLASTPRATPIKLEGRQTVEMQVGYDGKYVGITAIDLFGSLDKVKLLSHISKIYTDEEYKVKTSVAGAGIGLATVFRSGGSFFFVSESQARTEVTVFFKRTDSFREFKDQFRFISTQFYF